MISTLLLIVGAGYPDVLVVAQADNDNWPLAVPAPLKSMIEPNLEFDFRFYEEPRQVDWDESYPIDLTPSCPNPIGSTSLLPWHIDGFD